MINFTLTQIVLFFQSIQCNNRAHICMTCSLPLHASTSFTQVFSFLKFNFHQSLSESVTVSRSVSPVPFVKDHKTQSLLCCTATIKGCVTCHPGRYTTCHLIFLRKRNYLFAGAMTSLKYGVENEKKKIFNLFKEIHVPDLNGTCGN